MLNAILAKKGEMGARFNQKGQMVPATALLVSTNVILDTKVNKAVIGTGEKKKVKKTENKFVEKAGFAPRFVREVKAADVKAGDKISVSVFEEGDVVKVTGISKGKGFAGGMKRWGFHGGPKTHGQSDRHRAPGSIGQTTTPGRVYKGKKMAGHMGNVKSTTIGLEVLEIDETKNLIFVKGAVPGAKNGYLLVQKTGKAKNFVPLKNKSQETKANFPVEPTQETKEEVSAAKDPKEEVKTETKEEPKTEEIKPEESDPETKEEEIVPEKKD